MLLLLFLTIDTTWAIDSTDALFPEYARTCIREGETEARNVVELRRLEKAIDSLATLWGYDDDERQILGESYMERAETWPECYVENPSPKNWPVWIFWRMLRREVEQKLKEA